MQLKRNDDGTYSATYDGSKEDLTNLANHLINVSHAGVGSKGFKLYFEKFLYDFQSARELFFFAEGLRVGMEAPFIEKLRAHVSSYIGKIFNLDKLMELPIEEDKDPEQSI